MPPAPIPEVEPDELKALLDAGQAVLVDVREPEEFAEAAIPGAVLVPLSRFDPAAFPDAPGKRLILHCRSGGRSERAGQALRAAGREVAHLRGGLLAWQEAGLPVERGGSG